MNSLTQFLPRFFNKLSPKNGDVIASKYRILQQCGSGSFSTVYKCQDLEKHQIVAIKFFSDLDTNFSSEAKVSEFLTKHDLYKDFFLNYKGAFMWNHHFCIVTDFFGISLYQAFQLRNFQPFPIYSVKFIVSKIARAVNLMHQYGMIHTDIKLENILLPPGFDWQFGFEERSISEPMSPILKTSQFSFSIELSNPASVPLDVRLIDFGCVAHSDQTNTQLVSTREYRAPEILMGLPWNEKCDSWSLGCLLIEMLTGSISFDAIDDLTHLFLIQHIIGPFPDWMIKSCTKKPIIEAFYSGLINPSFLSEESKKRYLALPALRQIIHYDSDLLNLALSLLDPNPNTRASIKEILNNPFLNIY